MFWIENGVYSSRTSRKESAMNTPRFLLCLPLILIASVSQAQLLCTPMGAGATYCGGWDANMNNRAFSITPLPGGSSMLTDLTPRRTEPIVIERSHFAESLLTQPYRSVEPRRSHFDSLMERSAPSASYSTRESSPLSDWHLHDDDLPPLPESEPTMAPRQAGTPRLVPPPVPSIPTLQEFLTVAQPHNPGMSRVKLTLLWNELYGHNELYEHTDLNTMPTLETFLPVAKKDNPGVSEARLKQYWRDTYGVLGISEKNRTQKSGR